MASGEHATNYLYRNGRKMVVELQYEADVKKINALKADIGKALASGSAALVRGWQPHPPLDFTEEDIALYRPTTTQRIEAQGTYNLCEYVCALLTIHRCMQTCQTPEDKSTKARQGSQQGPRAHDEKIHRP